MRLLGSFALGVAAYLAGAAGVICIVWLTVWIVEHT